MLICEGLINHLEHLFNQARNNDRCLEILRNQVRNANGAPMNNIGYLQHPPYQPPLSPDETVNSFNRTMGRIVTRTAEIERQVQEIQALRYYLYGLGLQPLA